MHVICLSIVLSVILHTPMGFGGCDEERRLYGLACAGAATGALTTGVLMSKSTAAVQTLGKVGAGFMGCSSGGCIGMATMLFLANLFSPCINSAIEYCRPQDNSQEERLAERRSLVTVRVRVRGRGPIVIERNAIVLKPVELCKYESGNSEICVICQEEESNLYGHKCNNEQINKCTLICEECHKNNKFKFCVVNCGSQK